MTETIGISDPVTVEIVGCPEIEEAETCPYLTLNS